MGTWGRWLDALPFVSARLRRFLAAHYWARVDLTMPTTEVEIATAALGRRGWRRVALVDGDPAVLVFSVRVGSGDTSAAALLAGELTVALADARVRGPFWYSIDADRPEYQLLTEWRPARSPDGSAQAERGPSTRVRTYAPSPDASAGALRTGQPTDGMEPVGTLSERVGTSFARLRTAWAERRGAVVCMGVAVVVLTAAFVATQMRWPAAGSPPRVQEFLWWRDRRLALVLTASVAVAVAALLLAPRAPQRPGRLLRTVALLAGAAAVGMGAGGMARLERSWGAAGGAGLLFVAGWAWRRAGYVRRRLPRDLLRLVSLGGVVGLVGLYGRVRAWTYYASMGARPSAVGISAVDAGLLGARPVGLALVTMALFLALAWMVSGHLPLFPGAAMTLVAFGAAGSILAGQLGVDRVHGRDVAAGRAAPTTQHVAFDPGPTPVCVEWIAPELAPALPGPLPRLVWEVGTAGPDTLLLDPEVARASYSALTPDQKAHLPHGDVDAPIWYVPAGQFRPRQPVGARCDPLRQPPP